MVQPDGFPTQRERRFLASRTGGMVSAAVAVVVIVLTFSRLTASAVDVDLPFPDGRQVTIRLPSDIVKETTSRELDFVVQRGSIVEVVVVVTDDPAEGDAALTGEVVSVGGTLTPWRLVRGERGLVDRVILSTESWALTIGMPDNVYDPTEVVTLVELTEEDGLPVVELSAGTRLAEPPTGDPREWLVYGPRWIYGSLRGEWVLSVVPSCEDIPRATRLTIEPTMASCDPTHRVYLSAFGDIEYLNQMRESFEIVSPPPD